MKRNVSALVLSLLAVATAGAAQTPPKDLHLAGDHWTAWNPPSEFPQDAEVYTIVRGDTLWDLAATFLGDPYLWPQIWELNQYVLDAHWIYPGDPLVLGIQVTTPEQEPELFTEMVEEEPVEEVAEDLGPQYPLVQLGHQDDIYCTGYIGDPEEEFPYRVSGSEYEVLGPAFDLAKRGRLQAKFGAVDTIKYGLDAGDIVYLDRGRDSGLSPGQVFTSVRRGEIVRHPLSGDSVGRFYAYLGRVRVLSVQESSAIGEIVHSCHFITIGEELRPFVSEPIPSKRRTPMRPEAYPVEAAALDGAATIVHSRDGIVVIGKDHVVFIDRGTADGLVAGDVLTVYRPGPTNSNNPPVVLGELGLLSVREHTALAKVIDSRHPIYIGDRVLAD